MLQNALPEPNARNFFQLMPYVFQLFQVAVAYANVDRVAPAPAPVPGGCGAGVSEL